MMIKEKRSLREKRSLKEERSLSKRSLNERNVDIDNYRLPRLAEATRHIESLITGYLDATAKLAEATRPTGEHTADAPSGLKGAVTRAWNRLQKAWYEAHPEDLLNHGQGIINEIKRVERSNAYSEPVRFYCFNRNA
jgi:hypothetical protein